MRQRGYETEREREGTECMRRRRKGEEERMVGA